MRVRVAVGLLAALGCEPPSSACADGVADVGVFCFPKREVVRLGHGFAPEAMAIVDLDEDGALDVAAVNPARQTLSITWGAADGSFTRLTSWPLAEEVAGLAHGDLDGDGDIDLATALPGSDRVAVLVNHGARRFALRHHATGDTPRALLAVNLDGAGAAELVTANIGEDSIRVLRRGVADPPTIVGHGPRGLAAGDLDGDGAPELAVALADDDLVQVLRNVGGALVPGARHPVGVAPGPLVIADLDADGAMDLASADLLADSVSVVYGDGLGAARETRRWPVMRQPSGLTVVRGGGLPPMLGVVAAASSELVSLDPRTGALVSAGTLASAGAITAADLDRDGREALLYGGLGRGALAELRTGQGLYFRSLWQAPPVREAMALDVDGDGVDELAVIDLEGGLALWRGAEDPDTAARTLPVLEEYSGITAGDLDGDGREELIVWGRVADQEAIVLVRLVWMADTELFVAGAPVLLPAHSIDRPIVGDVGGDGTLDLVTAGNGIDPVTFSQTHHVLQISAEGEPRVLVESGVDLLVAADLDGDAALDLVTLDTDTDVLRAYTNVAVGATPRELSGLPEMFAIAADDLDGDGSADLMLGTPENLAVVFDVADPAAVPVVISEAPYAPRTIGDFDRDGDLDVFVQVIRESPDNRGRLFAVLVNDGAGAFELLAPQLLAGELQALEVLDRGIPGIYLLAATDERVEVLTAEPGPVLVEQPLAKLGVAGGGRLGDLDGDGRPDWFATDRLEMAAAFGQDGGFGPTHHVAGAGLLDADVTRINVALGDLDDDGADEVVVLGQVDGDDLPLTSLTVVRVDADGAFKAEPLTRIACSAYFVFTRDLDGDGRADLLLVGDSDDDEALVLTRLRGRGDGSFDPTLTQRLEFAGYVFALDLVEVHGDRRLDLMVRDERGVRIARGQGTGDFDPLRPWVALDQIFPGPQLFGDFDRDGRTDLVTGDLGSLLLFSGDGQRAAGAPRQTLRGAAFLRALAAGDLDGDGVDELLSVDQHADSQRLTRGRNTGAGSFVFTSQYLSHELSDRFELAIRDLDGDARPDVAILDDTSVTIVRQRP